MSPVRLCVAGITEQLCAMKGALCAEVRGGVCLTVCVYVCARVGVCGFERVFWCETV